MIQKFRFYLDVDGVILDFEAGFREMLKQRFPEVYNATKATYICVQELVLQRKMPTIQSVYDAFIRSEFFENLPMLCDPSCLLELQRLGDIIFVTNIPTVSVGRREKNLIHFGVNSPQIIPAGFETYGEKNYPIKSQAIRTIDENACPAFFVDDMTENYDDVHANIPHIRCYLMRSPENEHSVLKGYNVIPDLVAFTTEVKKIAL